jgi:hypothetical protein
MAISEESPTRLLGLQNAHCARSPSSGYQPLRSRPGSVKARLQGGRALQFTVRLAVQNDRSANLDGDFGHLVALFHVARHFLDVKLHEVPCRLVDHGESDADVVVYVDRVLRPTAFERNLDILSWWLEDLCLLWVRDGEPVEGTVRQVYERVVLFRGSFSIEGLERDVFDEPG